MKTNLLCKPIFSSEIKTELFLNFVFRVYVNLSVVVLVMVYVIKLRKLCTQLVTEGNEIMILDNVGSFEDQFAVSQQVP